MRRVKVESSNSDSKRKMRPALTTEARESQLISLATDLAEQQLRDGTASSQVITHYLKLGCLREKKEIESLEMKNKLMQAKIDSLKSAERTEEMYKEAIRAMQGYRYDGGGEIDDKEIF